MTDIWNRFPKTKMPPAYEMAEALRTGASTLTEIQDTFGVTFEGVRRKLNKAGWSTSGKPVREASRSERQPCERCGIERIVNTSREVHLCRDCQDVLADMDVPA